MRRGTRKTDWSHAVALDVAWRPLDHSDASLSRPLNLRIPSNTAPFFINPSTAPRALLSRYPEVAVLAVDRIPSSRTLRLHYLLLSHHSLSLFCIHAPCRLLNAAVIVALDGLSGNDGPGDGPRLP